MNVAVTGGANGIGRAVAEHFARAGARVVVGDIDGAAAEAVAASLGSNVFGLRLDVTDRESFAKFIDTAEARHGALDVMVNNAGIDWIGPFHEEPDEVSRREVEVNLLGAVTGSRLAVQRMLPRGRGHLVNVASGVGRVPLPGSAVYSATKHGVVGLTESLRLEYRGTGLRFSVIQPGQVETAMLDGQGRPALVARVTPDEVAAAVLDAVRKNRFEVWVPRNQAATAKIGNILPRRAREGILRMIGVEKIAGETDQAARRSYHERMFGRS
jgi:NAD(P)-dependent dehydrogenase (short-subunit alcohol dehydrogenase family)